MGSRKGGSIKAAETDFALVTGSVIKNPPLRYSTIRCGISPRRNDKHTNQCSRLRDVRYQEIFKTIAHSVGVYRHVVTLVANQVILKDYTLAAHGGWKTFYDRVWSAVQQVCKNDASTRNGTGDNKLAEAVKDILQEASKNKHLECVPKPVNFDLRQQEAVTMATQTTEYLETFYFKVRHKLNVEIASGCPMMSRKDVDMIARTAATYVFSVPSVSVDKRGELLQSMKHMDCESKDLVCRIADEERLAMGELVNQGTPREKKINSWLQCLKKDELYQLLPHMIRISTWSERWLEHHFGPLNPTSLMLLLDDCDDNDDAEDVTQKEDEKQMCDVSGRKWSKRHLAKPFSILPISRLQPAMVLYTATEVKTMLQSYKIEGSASKRRKRNQAGDDDPKKETAEDYFRRLFDCDHFGDVIFNRRSFKGHKGPFRKDDGTAFTTKDGTDIPKWRIVSFRTDGISASITFVSSLCGGTFNADNLLNKGYNGIVEPAQKIDLYDSEARGLYYVGEKRNDILKVEQDDLHQKPIRVTAIDPGFFKPVHRATVYTDAQDLMFDAKHNFVTEDEWMERSGRNMRSEAERQRRQSNDDYGKVLKDLKTAQRGRRSTTDKFCTYVETMLRTLSIRQSELVSESRSWLRWKGIRLKSRFIGRLCDEFFDRSTLRFHRQDKHARLDATPARDFGKRAQAPEERVQPTQDMLLELRKQREKRNAVRSVVFFGDASFGPTMRGHNAIPKKGILRELCHRGLTFLLDEHRTSLCCPCGQDELKTTTGRNRAHKSDDSTCPFLEKLGADDRDKLASLNMLQCAICAIKGADRPQHLCRSKAPSFSPEK